MAFDAGAIEARLTLSREDFNRELDAARADGQRFASEDFSARAGLRDDEFQAKRDAILAQIAELEAMRADPSVDINDEEVRAKLAELDAELARFGLRHETATADVDTSKADEGLERIRAEAVAAQSANIGLSTAIVGLGPAAGAALAPVAAGLGAALVPLTAATFGFGALAAVALPTLSQVKDALSKPNEELSKMPPNIAQVVGGIRAFQGEWGVLASKLQPDVLGVMNQGLTIGRGLLPQLVAPAREAAFALGDLGQSAQRSLGSPVWRGWSTSMTAQVRPAIDSLGHSFGNLVAGLGGVINAFVPFAAGFEAGMVRITNGFRLWGENLGTSQGFQTFMTYVRDNAGTVRTLIENLGHAFVSLAGALSGFGALELRALSDLAAALNALLRVPTLGPIVADLAVLAFTAGKLAPAFTIAGDAIGGFVAKADLLLATRLGTWLTEAAAGLGLFTTGLSIAGAASLTLQAALGPLGVALAALAAGYGYLVAQQAGAKSAGEQVASSMDSQSQATLHSANTQADYRAAVKQANDALMQFTFDTNDHNRSVAQQDVIRDQLNKTLDQTTKASDNATAALKLIDQQTGLTDQQASALARTLNVDLTKTAPAEALMRVKAALQSDADQAGLTTDAFARLAAESGKSMSDITKAVKQSEDATTKAFSDFGDITKAKLGGAFGVLGSDISKFYSDNVKQAQTFSENVNKAIQAGYDPQLISRILQAGPAQAGPLLQSMVTNASSKFVEMVNNGEKALSDLTQKAVEQQRLMTLAVQSGSNQMSQDLSKAMQADQIIMAQGGSASVSALAKSLGEGIPQVLQQLNEFGIHFKLSSDDYGRIMDAGGKEAADNIANALANGRPLTQEQLSLLQHAFDNEATQAGVAGSQTGGGFGSGVGDQLNQRGPQIAAAIAAYQGALHTGIDPLLQAIGSNPIKDVAPPDYHPVAITHGFATGGIVDMPMMLYPNVVVGEEAPKYPEVVLSTNPAYHDRNVGLYKQAGHMLGLAAGGCAGCQGFAQGGIIGGATAGLQPGAYQFLAWLGAQGVNASVSSGDRPGDGSSYHALGQAVDLVGDMVRIAGLVNSVGTSIIEGIHNPGLSIKNGANVDPGFWGAATWAAHMNHVHVAVPAGSWAPGAGLAGGAGVPCPPGAFCSGADVPKPPDYAPWQPDHVSHPSTSEGWMYNRGSDVLYQAVVKYADAQAAQRTAAAAAAVSSAGGSPFGGGPVKAYMLGEVAKRWPGPEEASAFDYVEMREAGYDPNAQNASGAAGLAQNISGFGPGYERGNIQQQTAWMLNYIAGRYGDPIGAAAHERAFNWYEKGGILGLANGGIVNSPTLSMIGERGPEAVVPLGQGGAFGGNVTIDARIVFQGDVTDNIDARIQRAHAAQADRITRKLGLRGVTPAPGGVLR